MILNDFLDYFKISRDTRADACIRCLGISLQGWIKGDTERELALLSNNVFLFRLAFIEPADSNYKRPLVPTTIDCYITRLLYLFSDAFSIDAAALNGCLIGVAKSGSNKRLPDNIAIRPYQENFH